MPTELSAAIPRNPRAVWVIWGVGVFAYVVAVTSRTSLSAVGVDAADRFHADASTLSILAVMQFALYGAMQVPGGRLLDRYGSRPIITYGMVAVGLGQLLLAFAPNIAFAIIARMLLGVGDAVIFPGALRLVAVWFPAQRAPVMVQLTGIIGGLGQVVSVLPLPELVRAVGWSVAFSALASLAVLAAVLVYAMVRNRPAGASQDVSVNTLTGALTVVTSSVDLRRGFRVTWSHPATRLGFWSHFTTSFAGSAFIMLWGFPFLTAGEGRSSAEAQALFLLTVVAGTLAAPVIGHLSARFPTRRSLMLVLPTIITQMVVWTVVVLWLGRAPLWLLCCLVIALAGGGPASMIAFDHARTYTPTHRLSTATGMVNIGGFFGSVILMLLIGIVLDALGAGTPETYRLDAFRYAFLIPLPMWILGITMILVERHKTRLHVGLSGRSVPKRAH